MLSLFVYTIQFLNDSKIDLEYFNVEANRKNGYQKEFEMLNI